MIKPMIRQYIRYDSWPRCQQRIDDSSNAKDNFDVTTHPPLSVPQPNPISGAISLKYNAIMSSVVVKIPNKAKVTMRKIVRLACTLRILELALYNITHL